MPCVSPLYLPVMISGSLTFDINWLSGGSGKDRDPGYLMPDELVKRGYLTQSLGNAVHSGEHSFQNVPGLLRHVLEIHAWEKRVIVETGEEFPGFPSFESYVCAHPPKGLG